MLKKTKRTSLHLDQSKNPLKALNLLITLKLSFWKISSGIIDLKSSKSEVIEFVSSEAKDDADEKSDIC